MPPFFFIMIFVFSRQRICLNPDFVDQFELEKKKNSFKGSPFVLKNLGSFPIYLIQKEYINR